MAAAAGLTIVLSESDLLMRAHFINSAFEHYAQMRAADAGESAPSKQAEWMGGVAAACQHVLVAFDGGEGGWQHRLHRRLAKGIPPDSGDTTTAHRYVRLLLMRGFGEDWRDLPKVNGDLPDPWDLLYEGMPRFLSFTRALKAIAERAEASQRDESGTPGGSEKDGLRRNLMLHLCSVYRDLFGVLPTHSDRHGAHALRDTFPEGPAVDWFSDLLNRLEGERPTADAVKNWILWGKAELVEAAARLARDNAEFPE